MSARAVVFAYSDVGVRCLKALISAGIDVPLVVTHRDDPQEQRWYASVAETAADYGLAVVSPDTPNEAGFIHGIEDLGPDLLFSFYYRSMLDDMLLRIPKRGAFNMHGSLLPRYRGRAPVNWAILNGESETGATLHHMIARADSGDIVDQLAVPILRDDDALDVMAKVTTAAETVLVRSLPRLLDGTAPRIPQQLEMGSYFGRRRPEDGRIGWQRSAMEIHNLVRAVAPPFPGAFTDIRGSRWWIYRTRIEPESALASMPARLFARRGNCYFACADGGTLRLMAAATETGPIDLPALATQLGSTFIALT